jgi:hypothetical protein
VSGLQLVEQPEAHCLLHLGIAVYIHVGAIPEVVEVAAPRNSPSRTSKGSSTTKSRISLPLVTLMTSCPDSGRHDQREHQLALSQQVQVQLSWPRFQGSAVNASCSIT